MHNLFRVFGRVICCIPLFCAISCSNTNTYKLKPVEQSNFNSKDQIEGQCAIVIYPTEKQIDSLKNKYGEENFYTSVDDNQFYMAEAQTILDSLKIKTIHKESEGTLIFKLKDGRTTSKNIQEANWEILLFNGKDNPITADITDITNDLSNYMTK